MIFEEIFDEFERVVAEVFVDHDELDDNVLIENNSELKLDKGFCVQWVDATNTERTLDCLMSVSQTVIVTNTVANYGSDTDIEARKKAVKEVLSDSYKLVQVIENLPQLNDKAELVKFLSNSGPQIIFPESNDSKSFLMVQATYTLEWFKNKGEQ